MKDVIVTRKKYHIVRSLPGCTVRQEGANGTVIETTVPADEDTPVFAHSGRWSVEGDENVTVTEVFNGAPSGGGAVKILADETLVSSLASKAGNNTFTGSNVFNGAFRIEGNAAYMSVIDLRGMSSRTYKEYAIKNAAAWYTEVLYILANTHFRMYEFFGTMKDLFGATQTVKKIYIVSLGSVYYGSAFMNIKTYAPNISCCIVTGKTATNSDFDSWNILEVNADYFEHYCPNKKIHMRGMKTSTIGSMKLTGKMLERQDTGWMCLRKNAVRELNIADPKNASYVFYSEDSALKVARVNDGFWDKIQTANYAFYKAKGLLDLGMYPAALPALTQAANMFAGCELPGEYVVNLLASLPAYTDGATHELGIGIHIDHQQNEEVLAAIAEAEEKGWTITVQWNGTATVQTAGTFAMGTLIYAKTSERERSDGTTVLVLDWGHYVTNPERYETFRSLESAYRYFGIPMPEETSTETE